MAAFLKSPIQSSLCAIKSPKTINKTLITFCQFCHLAETIHLPIHFVYNNVEAISFVDKSRSSGIKFCNKNRIKFNWNDSYKESQFLFVKTLWLTSIEEYSAFFSISFFFSSFFSLFFYFLNIFFSLSCDWAIVSQKQAWKLSDSTNIFDIKINKQC